MKITPELTDGTVLSRLGERVAACRLALNRTQAELAREAGVSKRTLSRLEGGHSTQLQNLIRILRALGLLGNLDGLVPAPVPSPVEQLRAQGKRRKRASVRKGRPAPDSTWTWAEGTADGGEDA